MPLHWRQTGDPVEMAGFPEGNVTDRTPKRVVLHVGTPKTGTTAVQSAMAANRRSLSERGILYPKAGTMGGGSHGHHNLAYELASGPSRAKFRPEVGTWGMMADEVRRSRAPTVLISSEAFRSNLARPLASRCSSFWPEAAVEIVLYLRPQWEYVESGYNQLARFGQIEGETIQQFWERKGNRLGDYQRLLSAWEKRFPTSRVSPLPFTKRRMERGIVQDFEREVLRSGHDFGRMENANPKAGMRAISAVQYVKGELRRATGVGDLRVPTRAIFAISKLFRETFPDETDFVFMDPALEARIVEECEKINAWLRSKYPLFAEAGFSYPGPRRDRRIFKQIEFEGAERNALDDLVRRTLRSIG